MDQRYIDFDPRDLPPRDRLEAPPFPAVVRLTGPLAVVGCLLAALFYWWFLEP